MLSAIAVALTAVPLQFAIIGDFGKDGTAESDVANLVKSWNPEFIVTTGDNNYETGSATTIDANIGKHYHEFIYNYSGAYGAGSPTRRFFPILGNHDWGNASGNPTGANPYLAYFDLPGNERYYTFDQGECRFFMLDSDANEPSGITAGSAQAAWLQSELQNSLKRYNIVILHHAPYSSASHGPNTTLQWPFAAWGAHLVLAGHDHSYERLFVNGIPYIVNGLGGKSIYAWGTILPQSQFRYNSNYGAQKVQVTPERVTLDFIARTGVLVESFGLPSPYPSSFSWLGDGVGAIETLFKPDLSSFFLSSPDLRATLEVQIPAPLSVPGSLTIQWRSQRENTATTSEQVFVWDFVAGTYVRLSKIRLMSAESRSALLPGLASRYMDANGMTLFRLSYVGSRPSGLPVAASVDWIKLAYQ